MGQTNHEQCILGHKISKQKVILSPNTSQYIMAFYNHISSVLAAQANGNLFLFIVHSPNLGEKQKQYASILINISNGSYFLLTQYFY